MQKNDFPINRYKYLAFSLPLVAALLIFFIIKFSNLSLRLSDTNIYFYTAYEVLRGKLLYREIFFTDFPFFIYLSEFFLLISKNSLHFYYATAFIECGAAATALYLFSYTVTRRKLIAWSTVISYLFSILTLSTSDHQTGVFAATLSSTVGYIFFAKQKYKLSGVFLAIAVMTKAYAVPVIAGCMLFLLLKKQFKSFLILAAVFGITSLIIMSPFLVLASGGVFKDIVSYSLLRGQGIPKQNILIFFVLHDPLLFFLFIFAIFNGRKNLSLCLINVLTLAFVLFYTDIYYLYLSVFTPFLVLSLPDFFQLVEKKLKLQPMVLPTFLIILSVVNVFIYQTSFQILQKIPNASVIAEAVRKQHASVLYGTNDQAQLFAYLSGTPLLDGIIDTNSTMFEKHVLDAKKLTQDAISHKAVLLGHGAWYPEQNISISLLSNEIFDIPNVEKHCKLISLYPVKTEGVVNRLSLWRCF